MKGFKIFLLNLMMLSSISLSADLFDFKNSKKLKVELNGDIQGNILQYSNLSFENNFNGSVKLYEFLKLSGGLSIAMDDGPTKRILESSNTYVGLGLDFKEFGEIELKLDYAKSLGLKYEYNKKLEDLDINVRAKYSLFDSWLWNNKPVVEKEHKYELYTKLKYDLGKNFTFVTDLDAYLSTWFSSKKLMPYGLTVGAGVDYKNNILSGKDYKNNILTGAYISHYNIRNQQIYDEDAYEVYSGYHKGFVFKSYVGYEFEKSFRENGTISISGKLTADIDNGYFSRKEELKYNLGEWSGHKIFGPGNYFENRTHMHLIPEVKLGYKLNDNFDVEVEYTARMSFNKQGQYAGARSKIRTGVKYTWEK
ncbi:hypothetical protein [Streptobacillus ratti]|uniref:hypothetical protein n=1 Tax=Streptobacillus ratti TaxID=1720557 RepID=UPI000932E741|nr:hypothetical protein [Streptobacillus ratti]